MEGFEPSTYSLGGLRTQGTVAPVFAALSWLGYTPICIFSITADMVNIVFDWNGIMQAHKYSEKSWYRDVRISGAGTKIPCKMDSAVSSSILHYI